MCTSDMSERGDFVVGASALGSIDRCWIKYATPESPMNAENVAKPRSPAFAQMFFKSNAAK